MRQPYKFVTEGGDGRLIIICELLRGGAFTTSEIRAIENQAAPFNTARNCFNAGDNTRLFL
jgi:hypothetical protein